MMPLASLKILAVDDEEIMLKMYREYFSQQGVMLQIASSPAAAARQLEAGPVDVLILDLKLGKDSGKDLLTTVRRDHPRTRCVFVTAYATDELVNELYEMGVFEVIKKPCTIRTIFESIEKLALAAGEISPEADRT